MVLKFIKRKKQFIARGWLLLLLPLCSTAQESRPAASVSTGKIIETPAASLKTEIDNGLDAAYNAEGKAFYFRLTGTGTHAHTISTGDPLIFLLQNDSTVTLKSTAVQGFDDIDNMRSFKHEYSVKQQDLEMLNRSTVKALRKYSVIGFDDIYLEENAAAGLRSLTGQFLQLLDKEGLLKKVILTEPSFPGGSEVLLSFLNKNLKPLPVLSGRQSKTATVFFRVDETGQVSDLQVRQSAGTVYDNELLRILKRMPRWKPGLADGQPINRNVQLQLNFHQADEKIRVAWYK